MPITTVLFDLDNTLYSRHNGVHADLEHRMDTYVAQVLQLDLPEAHVIRKQLYQRYGTTIRGMMEEYQVDPEGFLEVVHAIPLERYMSPDIELDRLLQRVRSRRVIFTNSPSEHAERVLDLLGIRQQFSEIFDLRFFEFRSKPDAFGYKKALATLGVPGSQVVLVEDSPRNLPTAHALGMKTILVCEPPVDGPLSEADVIVDDVYSALEALLDLERRIP